MTPNEPKPKRTSPSLLRKAGTARRLARSGTGERAAGGAQCRYVAVIMDGNGRWARRRHLPVAAGHRAEEHLQQLTDKRIHEIDELLKHKEAEILEV